MASKILIYQTAFWGDLLLSVPLLQRIRDLFPKSELHLVCRKAFGALMRDLGLVDVVYEYDKSKHVGVLEWTKTFKGLTFDLLICPHESVRSTLSVSRISARHKIGFHRLWNFWVFDHRVPRSMDLPDYLRQLELLAPIDPWVNSNFLEWKEKYRSLGLRTDISPLPFPNDILDLGSLKNGTLGSIANGAQIFSHAPENGSPEKLRARLNWTSQKPTVLIAPGSQWNTKRWTESGFKDLSAGLIHKGYQIAFVGSRADSKIVENLGFGRHRSDDSESVAQDWTGETSPSELFCLFLRASVLVTNDSGPMHLASLAGCPTVGLFGPTTLKLGYQPANALTTIIQEDLPCRPCGLHGHDVCPLGTHDCMKKISAARVLLAVEAWITPSQTRNFPSPSL